MPVGGLFVAWRRIKVQTVLGGYWQITVRRNGAMSAAARSETMISCAIAFSGIARDKGGFTQPGRVLVVYKPFGCKPLRVRRTEIRSARFIAKRGS